MFLFSPSIFIDVLYNIFKEMEVVMGFDDLLFQKPFIETSRVNNWKLIGTWSNDILGPRENVYLF